MDARERVGRNVQALRRQLGLSQEALADEAGIHQTYLSGLENGRRNPSLMVLDRLAKALKVDLDALVRRA